jgi:hypothetical protein
VLGSVAPAGLQGLHAVTGLCRSTILTRRSAFARGQITIGAPGLSLTLDIQNSAEVPGMVGKADAAALNATLLGEEQDPIHVV